MADIDVGGSGGDYGASDGGTSGGGWPSASTLLKGGALAAGAAGFGAMVAQGPGSLPWEYGHLTSEVPGLEAEAGALEGQGSTLVGQGSEALRMAQHGELTPEQQAQLKQYQTGLTNQARQQFASMGRNPDQDTAFINQTANIDAQVNAMAAQQIQTTIQLGLGETSAGSSLIGQGLGFQNAANQALITAGEAQVKLDTAYSSSLTSAFSAIGTLFGAVAGGAAGGPAGAAAGASLGGTAGRMIA